MSLSISELATIREVISKLLDELQLESYVFDVEPQEGQWLLMVECAIEEGWQTVTLKANKDYFKHGADDAVFHQLLLDEWREALSTCKVKAT
ncbi:MAG: hypothetical protein OEW99_12085 [Gammaproteobacteria bacterium]|nr:hypothetical protein [Gammaproteobacteria bacterium]